MTRRQSLRAAATKRAEPAGRPEFKAEPAGRRNDKG